MVHLEMLHKICTALECELDGIVEIVPKENTHLANFYENGDQINIRFPSLRTSAESEHRQNDS